MRLPEQLAIGDKAAHKLLDYAPKFFVDKNKPANLPAADWANARAQVEKPANDFLYLKAILPAEKARLAKNCPEMESGYIAALGAYPDKSYLVYQLGLAYVCEKKMPQAAWELARAAAMDPTLSGTNANTKVVTDYAKKYYTNLHGNAEGYDEFVAKAKANLLPPDGFTIVNVDAQKAEAINKWNDEHKEAATWAGIKGSLTAPDGAAFFDSNMKEAAFPTMKGTLVEAVPACRPKTLLVSVPSFDNAKPPAEITLKFATALTGKPEVGGEITFNEGVSKTFTASPFMLTMEVDKDKIQGLTMTQCAAAPVPEGPCRRRSSLSVRWGRRLMPTWALLGRKLLLGWARSNPPAPWRRETAPRSSSNCPHPGDRGYSSQRSSRKTILPGNRMANEPWPELQGRRLKLPS